MTCLRTVYRVREPVAVTGEGLTPVLMKERHVLKAPSQGSDGGDGWADDAVVVLKFWLFEARVTVWRANRNGTPKPEVLGVPAEALSRSGQ